MTANYFLRDRVAEMLVKADGEWKDVYLISTMEQGQSLLYEYAEQLAVRALLKLVDLPVICQRRPNAVQMSPNGRVPFLRLDEVLISDFTRIVEFVELKGVKLATTRTAAENTDINALVSLVDNDLRLAEMHVVWLDEDTFQKVTKPRTACVHCFPANHIVPRLLRRQAIADLSAANFQRYTVDEVVKVADRVFQVLSHKLGSKNYIVGEQASELDALAFGHIYTILTTELPNARLATALKKYANLVDFCTRMEKELFVEHNDASSD